MQESSPTPQTRSNTPSLWQSNMSALQSSYIDLFNTLEGDTEGRIEAQAYLLGTTAICHGQMVSMGYLPKLYDDAALRSFDHIVETTYGILEKVTHQFIKDESYRKLFNFSPLLERMILLPSPYDCTIPIARFDIFLNEETGDFHFCEFNTDGTSAMSEDAGVTNALADTPLLRRFADRHKVEAQELHDTWVETFLDIYFGSSQPLPAPVVALVDYTESATMEEQLEYRAKFEEHGVVCLVADISTLEYKDGALYARDISKNHPAYTLPMRVDAVYRRVVTYEILRDLESTEAEAMALLDDTAEVPGTLHGALALLAAVSRQKVCMIGGFKTQVAHSKAIFCMLHHPDTLAILSEDEQAFVKRHVPFTTWLKPEYIDIQTVKDQKDRWIIKPVDGYMSEDVEAGKAFSEDAWHTLIDACVQKDFIVQEYCPQYHTLNTLPVPKSESGKLLFNNMIEAEQCAQRGVYDPLSLQPFNILTGLYSYGGSFGGIYIRAGQGAVIVGYRGGITMGALLVDLHKQPKRALRARTLME